MPIENIAQKVDEAGGVEYATAMMKGQNKMLQITACRFLGNLAVDGNIY